MRDHRSLEAWKEAHEITRVAFRVRRDHWKAFASPAFEQLQRAALSIQLNISEGYALGTARRFVNHLSIAYGSAVETAEILQLGLEERFLPEEVAEETLRRARRCQALLLGLMKRYRK